MIPRTPNRTGFVAKLLGGAIIFEAVGFGAAYLIWRKLNNNREFREKAKTQAPWALDIYYKMGELFDDKKKIIRETDEQVWKYKKAITKESE